MRIPFPDNSGISTAIALIAGAVVAVLLVTFVGVSVATDRPSFCNSCHEMKPYYDAWQAGPHSEHWCITCHVGPSMFDRFGHKFVALREVVSHFSGDNRFPRRTAPEVPPDRCRRCHPQVTIEKPAAGFDHAAHETYGPCQECHASVGHTMTSKALRLAGVLDASAAAIRSRTEIPRGAVAAQGAGRANIRGHTRVACTRCHDMAATGCPACHMPPKQDHDFGKECAKCHKAGAEWAFAHPKKGDCKTCHQPPRKGHPFGKNCRVCHRPAKSFAFFHPSDRSCRNCHTAPRNHFGSNCAACHSPSTAFENATFNHPGVGEEHSYRSFACSKCHPSGPPAVSCTCHGGRPPTEEGD